MTGAIDVQGPVDFAPEALRDHLAALLSDPAGALDLQRIGGGPSNPTSFATFAGRRMVLRKKPAGPILKGAHAVEREYRVLSALAGTAVPVPRPILLCEDAGIIGTPFYLMERVEGRVFADCALPGLQPEERRVIYLAMADALAALQAVDPVAVGLGDFGPPGDYFARQVARWSKQLAASTGEPIPELERVGTWLHANMPPDDGIRAIAHGDFRLGNLMFHPREPRVVAVLDWELSTVGHPLADLAFCAMPWHTAPDEYGGILGLGAAAAGIPDEAEFIARYRAGLPGIAAPTRFHLAFALFRFVVIFVGIADRARAGIAADPDAAALAPLARRFAIRALAVIDGDPLG